MEYWRLIPDESLYLPTPGAKTLISAMSVIIEEMEKALGSAREMTERTLSNH